MERKKNIWICEDGSPVSQRRFRYVEESIQHPSKNYPCVMRQAIELVSKPGDTILDPMAGIGTTLVEAMDLGRNAVGIEIEPHFSKIAWRNVKLAKQRNPDLSGLMVNGDSNDLQALIHDKVDHVVFSPPFTCELVTKNQKGLKSSRPNGKGYLANFSMQSNIAYAKPLKDSQDHYFQRMLRIYEQCHVALPTGGKMALVLRNPYRKGDEEDLIGETIRVCKSLGFQLKGRVFHVLPNITVWRIKQADLDKTRIPDYTETVLVFQKYGGKHGSIS